MANVQTPIIIIEAGEALPVALTDQIITCEDSPEWLDWDPMYYCDQWDIQNPMYIDEQIQRMLPLMRNRSEIYLYNAPAAVSLFMAKYRVQQGLDCKITVNYEDQCWFTI